MVFSLNILFYFSQFCLFLAYFDYIFAASNESRGHKIKGRKLEEATKGEKENPFEDGTTSNLISNF